MQAWHDNFSVNLNPEIAYVAERNTQIQGPAGKPKKNTLASAMGFATAINMGVADEVEEVKPPRNELEEYLALKKVNGNWSLDFVLPWWKEKVVERKWSTLSPMVRQFLGSPASAGGVERLFSLAGKKHDALKKATQEKTIEDALLVAKNTEY